MKEFNPSYISKRNDIVKHVPNNSKYILDIGCSTGTVGKQIKEIIDVHITGIELSRDMANEASKYLDKVIIGNVEKEILKDIENGTYDCIILADIIEHLVDPWKLIRECYRILRNEGIIIASIPNVRHFSTIISLVFKGHWPYRDRGIHDKTHLRFFTIRNIKQLFENEKFKKRKVFPNYRIIEKPHKINNKLNKYNKIFSMLPLKKFFVFQYIVTYKK